MSMKRFFGSCIFLLFLIPTTYAQNNVKGLERYIAVMNMKNAGKPIEELKNDEMTIVGELHYLGVTGGKQKAELTKVKNHDTTGLHWLNTAVTGGSQKDIPAIDFFDDRDQKWTAKVKCIVYDQPGVVPNSRCWFDEFQVGGANRHQDYGLLIRDWNHHLLEVHIVPVMHFPEAPKFAVFKSRD